MNTHKDDGSLSSTVPVVFPPTGIDWEDAFVNGDYIPGADAYYTYWVSKAAQYRQACGSRCQTLAYGAHERERLDLFWPEAAAPKGLVLLVHGGFWHKTDGSFWSHLARGCVESGWAVALPSYVLAPEVGLPYMTNSIATALQLAASKIEGPIHLTGHSAGGHLATRMVCQDTPLDHSIRNRIGHVVSISGLHDLRPLRRHSMNAMLNIDASVAKQESTVLQRPIQKDSMAGGLRVTAWVGSLERPEFLRQSAVLAEAWRGETCQARLQVADGKHHFDVIEDLERKNSPLVRSLLQQTP